MRAVAIYAVLILVGCAGGESIEVQDARVPQDARVAKDAEQAPGDARPVDAALPVDAAEGLDASDAGPDGAPGGAL